MNEDIEDWELENRRIEWELEKGDQKLKLQQEDEVMNGVQKIGSNTDAFLSRNSTAEFRDDK